MAEKRTDKSISETAAEKLISAHDGDCALLYIWHVRRRSTDCEKAAGDLCMTLSQVEAAMEKLMRMGLIKAGAGDTSADHVSAGTPEVPAGPDGAQKVYQSDEFPEYTAEDIASAAESDSGFRALQSRLEEITGKIPNRHDLSRLLGIYNHLGLPADVIYVLFGFCADISRTRGGAERRPTMSFIERQAYCWVNRGITTAEEAEEYVEKQKALLSKTGEIKAVLEIYDRNLTTEERTYILSWLEDGFDEDAIRIAYERTVNKTGKRAMSYLNKILQSWKENGILTVRDIEEKDSQDRKGSRQNAGSTQRSQFDPNRLNSVTVTPGKGR